MNNTFSFPRVMLYARKHYAENIRIYLFGILALAAITALGIYIAPNLGRPFLVMLMLIGSVFATQINCRSHYDRQSIEQSYTLPATSFEKFSFLWFNSTIVATLVITAVVLSVASLFNDTQSQDNRLIFSEIYYGTWILFFLNQSATLFGCCLTKGSPRKGYFIIISLMIVFLLLCRTYWQIVPSMNLHIDILNAQCSIRSDSAAIYYPLLENVSQDMSIQISGFLIPFLWIAAYFKFKERTVK